MQPVDIGAWLTPLHPAVVHYPIAFLTYALALDLYHWRTRRRITPFVQWTLVLGVVACVPSMVSGWFAAEPVVDGNPMVAKMVPLHNIAAYAVFFGAIMYAGLRVGELYGEWKASRALKASLGAVLLVALVATGFTGGKLTRAHAAEARNPEAQDEEERQERSPAPR